MKRMRKLAGILLAMVMILGITTTAFAADTTISVKEGDTRSYDVYQIFTGDLSGSTLSNVKWGKNGTGTVGTAVGDDVLEELVAATGSDTEKLAVIDKYVNMTGEIFGSVSAGNPLTAPTGYYLFVDKGAVQPGESYSLYVVKVVGPTTIDPKRGEVTVEKKVKDTNDSTNVTSGWQDSADYDIGDKVPFQLTGIVADDYANYKTYYFSFHDTLSAGLDFNNDVVVKVDGNEITSGYEVVTSDLDECTFEVVFDNLKDISAVKAGSVITVEYTAKLNEDAVIGSLGNENEVYLEYSNNPNSDEKGETEEDTVIVFTYTVIVNKVDKNGNALTGAGFTLYKMDSSGTYNALGDEITGEALSTFTWSGLDDGNYKLVETTTPPGYNTIAPIEFIITAEHDIESATPALTELNGGTLFESDLAAGSLTAAIINETGIVLPETGGMGTTIFYVVGAILLIGSAVLLITKKRMSAE